jgi:flagellar FliL protein
MADEKVAIEKVKGGTPLIPLILAMFVTMGGAVGGAMFWLTKSGRLPVQPVSAAAAVSTKTEPSKTKLIQFEPMLVNLADPGGAGYLRMVMVLRVEDPPPVKGEKPKEEKPPEKGKVVVDEDQVTVRDAALAVLSRQTSDQLLVPEGKEKLKQELRAALAVHEPKLKVQDVLFTEFLVQR